MRTGRAGHLNVLLQFGSMPKELTFDQIERFSEILPPAPDVGRRVREPVVAGVLARAAVGLGETVGVGSAVPS